MKAVLIAIVALVLTGISAASTWGYMVDESRLNEYQALGHPSPGEVSALGGLWGVVPDVARVIAAANQTAPDTWQINHTTFWKPWNNMQWHMKPYPAFPFQSAEVGMSHVTIWHSTGSFYLVAVPEPA